MTVMKFGAVVDPMVRQLLAGALPLLCHGPLRRAPVRARAAHRRMTGGVLHSLQPGAQRGSRRQVEAAFVGDMRIGIQGDIRHGR